MATSAIWSFEKCPQCKNETILDGKLCAQCEKDNKNPKKQYDKLYLFDLKGDPETHIRIHRDKDFPEVIIWGKRIFIRDPGENTYFEAEATYIGNKGA